MIYLIMEYCLDSGMSWITAHTNKKDCDEHEKLCNKLWDKSANEENTYRYTVMEIPYYPTKKKLCNSITTASQGGLETTKEALKPSFLSTDRFSSSGF